MKNVFEKCLKYKTWRWETSNSFIKTVCFGKIIMTRYFINLVWVWIGWVKTPEARSGWNTVAEGSLTRQKARALKMEADEVVDT